MLQLQCGKMVSEHYYTAKSMLDTNVEDHSAPLTVNSCGRVARILPFTTDAPMGRQDYYLMYMLHGRLQARFGDTEAVLTPGCFVYISPHTPYRYSKQEDGEIHYLTTHFTGSEAVSILASAGIRANIVYFAGLDARILEAFESMFSAYRNMPDHFPFLVDAHVRYILACLSADAQAGQAKRGRNLDASLRYIHSNLNAPVSVSELAAMEYLSPSRYRSVFKKEKGCSPQEYITRQKIQRACSLLADSPADIREIAEKCGYPDRLYFQRIFKKETGMTPAAYRRQARGDEPAKK